MAEPAQTWWAKAILIGSIIAAVLLPVGALGSRFGIWPFQTGFLMLGLGVILAALAFCLGIVALVVATRRKLSSEKSSLYVGLTVSVLVVAVLLVQFNAARSVPQIHNISTDVNDPPAFSEAIAGLRGEGSNPLAYDPAELAEVQQAAYPFVQPIRVDLSPAQAFQRAVAVVEEMGLDVVSADPAAGRIEATDTTFWFGFKDDLVVRIREAGAGAVVDLRSVSRVGLSDLGLNARRIGTFMDAFQAGG